MPSAEGETSCWPLEYTGRTTVSSVEFPLLPSQSQSCCFWHLMHSLGCTTDTCQCVVRPVYSSGQQLVSPQLKQREKALQAPHELCMGQTPTAVVPCCPPQSSNDWSMLNTRRPSWYQTTAVLPRSCMTHLTPQQPQLHSRLHQAATSGKAIQKDTQGEEAYLCSSPCIRDLCLPEHSSIPPLLFAGKSGGARWP